MTPEEIAQLRRAYEYEYPNVSQTPESYERGFQNWLARNNYQEQPQRREIKKGQYIPPDELKFRQAVIDKYYIDNPQNRARYREETRYNQDEGFQKKHPIANTWYNFFKPVAGPTGYAVPMNTQMPEVTQEPATVNDLVASVNANGSLYDYNPEGVQLPRDLDVLNKINPQTGRPYGRDLEEMQNPMTNAQNPEWTRRRVRDLININRIKQ